MAIPFLAAPLVKTIISFIKTKFFGQGPSVIFIGLLVAFALVILVPNFDNISEKLGMDTKRSLSVKLEQQRENTKTALDVNEELNNSLKYIEATSENKELVIEKFSENKIKSMEIKATRLSNKVDKITMVKEDVKKSNIEKEREISSIQINSLWDTYCDFNIDSECNIKVA